MVKRATIVKLAILMAEITSPPLLLLIVIYLLSGYQMLIPTVKLLSESRRIHIDRFLRLLTVAITYIHTTGGAIFIIERQVKREFAKKAFEIAVVTALTVLMLLFLILEVMLVT